MASHQCTIAGPDGSPQVVTFGWDRRLRGYWMTVHPQGRPDEPVYSNLTDPDLLATHGMADNLDHFGEWLADHRMHLPPAMYHAAWLDSLFNLNADHLVYDAATGRVLPPEPSAAREAAVR